MVVDQIAAPLCCDETEVQASRLTIERSIISSGIVKCSDVTRLAGFDSFLVANRFLDLNTLRCCQEFISRAVVARFAANS
jgi:hypothetical protein